MATMILYGFDAAELNSLLAHLPTGRWREGCDSDLSSPRPEDRVWVVNVRAAELFLDAVFATSDRPTKRQPPRTVLWAPRGQQPHEPKRAWEVFSACLREGEARDEAFLQSLGDCPRILDWCERVEEIEPEWFAARSETPRACPIDALPFASDERRHLGECTHCQEECYQRLQHRAERRWAMLCPNAEAIGLWLEGDPASLIEQHLAGCATCKEVVLRLAWLWQGSGLLPAAQVRGKFTSIGLSEEPLGAEAVLTGKGFGATDLAMPATEGPATRSEPTFRPGKYPETSAPLVVLLILLRSGLVAGRPRSPARGMFDEWDPETAKDPKAEAELLLQELTAGDSVELLGEGRWVRLRLRDEILLLETGLSRQEPLMCFTAEFRCGTRTVVAVPAEDGVARLTHEHLKAAREERSDHFLIVE